MSNGSPAVSAAELPGRPTGKAPGRPPSVRVSRTAMRAGAEVEARFDDDHQLMRTSYAVTWQKADEAGHSGRLELQSRALTFEGSNGDGAGIGDDSVRGRDRGPNRPVTRRSALGPADARARAAQRRSDPHRQHRAPGDHLRARRAARLAPPRRREHARLERLSSSRSSRAPPIAQPSSSGEDRRSIPTRSASAGTRSSSPRARRSSSSRLTPPGGRPAALGRSPLGRRCGLEGRGSGAAAARRRCLLVVAAEAHRLRLVRAHSGPGRQRRRRRVLTARLAWWTP